MHNTRLQAALRTLQAHPTVQVVFLMDNAGALLAWTGTSPAFSPVGQFPARPPEPQDENLYLTLLANAYYLGVLFDEGVPIDDIRALVTAREPELRASLGV